MPVRVVMLSWRQTQQNTGQKWKALKYYRIVYKIFGRTNLHTQLIQKYHNRNPKNPTSMSWAMPAYPASSTVHTVAVAQYVNRYARSLFHCFLSVSHFASAHVYAELRERESQSFRCEHGSSVMNIEQCARSSNLRSARRCQTTTD